MLCPSWGIVAFSKVGITILSFTDSSCENWVNAWNSYSAWHIVKTQ